MSPKTIAEKMYIKLGMQAGFKNAAENLNKLLGGLPEDVTMANKLKDISLDFILAFIKDRQMLEAYHKDGSSVNTNINCDTVNSWT